MGNRNKETPQEPTGKLAWCVQQLTKTDPAANRMVGKDQTLRVSPDLHMCTVPTLTITSYTQEMPN